MVGVVELLMKGLKFTVAVSFGLACIAGLYAAYVEWMTVAGVAAGVFAAYIVLVGSYEFYQWAWASRGQKSRSHVSRCRCCQRKAR